MINLKGFEGWVCRTVRVYNLPKGGQDTGNGTLAQDSQTEGSYLELACQHLCPALLWADCTHSLCGILTPYNPLNLSF
jgi:hypothetical protein